MKAKLCLRSVRTLQLVIFCTAAVSAWIMNGSLGNAALPTLKSALAHESSQAKTTSPAPRLSLEINVVEYPEEKGMDVFRIIGLANAPAGSFIETPAAPRSGMVPDKSTHPTITQLAGPETPMKWILTKNLNEFILDKLNQSADAQVIAGPRIIAAEGERRKVEFEYPGKIIRQLSPMLNSNELPEGPDAFPTLYFEPKIQGDGYTIDLNTTQTIRDLVAYNLGGGADDVWDYVESSGANPSPRSAFAPVPVPTRPKPLYRLRQVTGNAVVGNGQTLVLSGLTASNVSKMNIPGPHAVPLLGDLPIAGRLFRASTVAPEKKKLLVFITPTIVGEDGKPIHEQAAPEDTAPTPVK